MELAGTILFFGSLLGMIIWLLNAILKLGRKESFIRRELHGEKIVLNILPGTILFIVMAISAGIAWG